jgi:hypothetical protein
MLVMPALSAAASPRLLATSLPPIMIETSVPAPGGLPLKP